MQIHQLVEDDFEKVCKLRLAALQDSPNSFADSFEDTRKYSTDYWIELTKSLCNEHVMFILEIDGELAGSVYGLRDVSDNNVGRVAGMWVTSSYRGRGYGTALLEQVVIWVQNLGILEMRLWAPAKSSTVIQFYKRNGFALTGVQQQTPKPHLAIVEMNRLLDSK